MFDCKKQCNEGTSEEFKIAFKKLVEIYGDKLEFIIMGQKHKHVRVAYKYHFEDFNLELKKIQQVCNEFFDIALNGVNQLLDE